jgi:ankyrin repeat protein
MSFFTKLFKPKRINTGNKTSFFNEKIEKLKSKMNKGKNITNSLQKFNDNINYQNIFGDTFLHYCIKKRVDPQILINLLTNRTDIDINLQNNDGNTPLMLAVIYNMKNIVIELLKNPNINVNLKDIGGNTALMLAIKKDSPDMSDMSDITEILLNRTDIDINLQNDDGFTVLMLVIDNRLITTERAFSIIDKILDFSNIDINLKNNKGFTVLMLFIDNSKVHTERRTVAIVDRILGFSNIDVNLINNDKNSALILAIEKDRTYIAVKLLEKPNIDVNLENIYKKNALILAVKHDNLYFISKLLIKPNVNVNLQDNAGYNALMYAISSRKFDIIDELLKTRIDIDFNLENNKGETALDLCREFKLPEKYIISMGGSTKKDLLCKFIDKINKIIRESIREGINKKNLHKININYKVYNDIITFLKDNYNLTSTYSNGIITVSPKKNKSLLYIIDNIIDNINNNIFYKNITVRYKTNTGNIAGINAGGLTRNFFFECQQQLNELFKYYLSNKKNNVITKKASSNINSNKIKYYDELQKVVDWKNYIIVVKILIFSKINNCPIYLDKELFGKLSQIILKLIIISNKYSLIQKIFIINMLQKYKDILNKELYYGMYDLLLTERHRINMNNLNDPSKSERGRVINTYISEINEAKKINRNAENQKNMNNQMQQLKKNLKENGNMGLSFIIEDAISKGIYKDLVDFYYTHIIPHIVTFKTFTENLTFYKGYKGLKKTEFINENEFKNKIIKLFRYMNEKDENNILLLAQAMTGNTLLAPTYTINMYPKLSGNNAKAKPASFHTCFNSVDFYEDNFPFVITSNNKTKNDENLENFIHLLKSQIDSNFIG